MTEYGIAFSDKPAVPQRCVTCKHWGTATDTTNGDDPEVKACGKIVDKCDGPTLHLTAWTVSYDGSGLRTRGEFGCVLWAEKT